MDDLISYHVVDYSKLATNQFVAKLFPLNYTSYALQIHIVQGLQPLENKKLHIT